MRSYTKFQATRTFISSRSRVPGGWGGENSNNHVKPNPMLRLGWGFDKMASGLTTMTVNINQRTAVSTTTKSKARKNNNSSLKLPLITEFLFKGLLGA